MTAILVPSATAKSPHIHLQSDGQAVQHLPLGVSYNALQYNAGPHYIEARYIEAKLYISAIMKE